MLGVFKRILIHLGPQVRQGVQRGLKECRGRRRGGGGVGSRFVAVEIHKAVVFFTILYGAGGLIPALHAEILHDVVGSVSREVTIIAYTLKIVLDEILEVEDVLIEILVVENVMEVVVVDKGVMNMALVEEETT